jgi:hypothetical protein
LGQILVAKIKLFKEKIPKRIPAWYKIFLDFLPVADFQKPWL